MRSAAGSRSRARVKVRSWFAWEIETTGSPVPGGAHHDRPRLRRGPVARPGAASRTRLVGCDEDLRARLLDLGAQPLPTHLGVLVARTDRVQQGTLTNRIADLSEHEPGDLGVVGDEQEVTEVPQEQH